MTSKRKSPALKIDSIIRSVKIVKDKGGSLNDCPFKSGSKKAEQWISVFNGNKTKESGTDVADDSSE